MQWLAVLRSSSNVTSFKNDFLGYVDVLSLKW